YRVEGIIPESTSKLSDFLYKPENRVTWDKSLKMYSMVQKIDSSNLMQFVSGHIHMSYHYTKFCHGLNIPPRLYRLSVFEALRREYGYYQLNPAYSKLVMFVQTEMRGKLAPSIIEATMPSNLVSFLLNVKDGVKTQNSIRTWMSS
ncbi:hypothetical protein EI555_008478, partial [Monodon monoceros]